MKIYIIRVISLFLSVLTAAMIFSFSADTAKESSQISSEITDKVLSSVGIDKETTPPAEYEKTKSKTEFSIRKLAHFAEYCLLGFFLCIFFRTFDRVFWLTLLFSLGVAVPYAALDEWHQSFVPGRGPGVKDVLIDSAGALVGAVVARFAWFLGVRVFEKRKIKRLA